MPTTTLNIPINPTSFGNVGYALANRMPANIFPIGNLDFGPFDTSNQVEQQMIQQGVESAPLMHSRDNPSFKLWHINGLMESVSKKQIAMTFHETDSITPIEANILQNQDAVIVTSKYTKGVFEEGCPNGNFIYCPLGFDEKHFGKTEVRRDKDAIYFNLSGKMEDRKNTLRILKLWCDKYGGDFDFRLNCTITNFFLPADEQSRMIENALGGAPPGNVNFLEFVSTNVEYNKLLNCCDIDLTGLSSCEGFNLPAFNALCLGKWCVFLDAHVHKDYANEQNAILVEPSGMRDAADGVFFHPGQPFNQGKWFDVEDEAILDSFDRAVEKAKTPNPDGEALSEKFTYSNLVEKISNLLV